MNNVKMLRAVTQGLRLAEVAWNDQNYGKRPCDLELGAWSVSAGEDQWRWL